MTGNDAEVTTGPRRLSRFPLDFARGPSSYRRQGYLAFQATGSILAREQPEKAMLGISKTIELIRGGLLEPTGTWQS